MNPFSASSSSSPLNAWRHAVHRRKAPKRKNTSMKRSMIADPARMKMPRKMRARMMPTMSTCCWYFLGTDKPLMMMTNTNRLSMLRLYSVSQPARNSPPCSASPIAKRTPAKTRARPT